MNAYEKVIAHQKAHPGTSIVDACKAVKIATSMYYYWKAQTASEEKPKKKSVKKPKVVSVTVAGEEPRASAGGKVMMIITDPQSAAEFVRNFNGSR